MKLGTTAALVLWSVLLPLYGQRPSGPPRMVLQALDSDADGNLSATEIARAAQSLSALDRNVDGQLTPDELSARPENAGATADELVTQLMSLDKNGDGVLSASEMPARMQSMFSRGDANGDGKLTPDEIRAMARRQGMPSGGAEGVKRMAAMMKNDPLLRTLDVNSDGVISKQEIADSPRTLLLLDTNHDGQISPNEMKPRQQTPQERVEHMLDEWDTNKDGKIAKAEAPDRMQQSFETLDKNGNGFLDRDELIAYFAANGTGPRGGSPPAGSQRPPQSEAQTGAAQAAPKEQK